MTNEYFEMFEPEQYPEIILNRINMINCQIKEINEKLDTLNTKLNTKLNTQPNERNKSIFTNDAYVFGIVGFLLVFSAIVK